MYHSGQMQLETNGWMQSRIGERPAFEAAVSRGFSSQSYHVFLMPQGILFLDKARPKQENGDMTRNAALAGAMVGGLVGAAMGVAMASAMKGPAVVEEEDFNLCENEHLLMLARGRKKSFISLLDDARMVAVDAPGALGRVFGSVAGWITVRDSRLGKIVIDVKEQTSLSAAAKTIPGRYGDRASVNVRWDDNKQRFVPKGR
jgi:hypothetical protein